MTTLKKSPYPKSRCDKPDVIYFCDTPYCSGVDYIDPYWDGDYWVAGYGCDCGCSNILFSYDNATDEWEMM